MGRVLEGILTYQNTSVQRRSLIAGPKVPLWPCEHRTGASLRLGIGMSELMRFVYALPEKRATCIPLLARDAGGLLLVRRGKCMKLSFITSTPEEGDQVMAEVTSVI